MAQFINYYEVDLWEKTAPQPLRQIVGEGDASGLRVGAVVTSNGTPVTLNGSCVGKVVRADGATVTLTGHINGNIAYVVLDQQSCAVDGPIQVAVCWVSGSSVTTLVIAYGTVVSTQTGTAIQPSTPIPDLAELLAAIDEMEAATAAAQAASTAPKAIDSMTNALFPALKKGILVDNVVTAIYGTFTSGKAWKKDRTQITGNDYCYTVYTNSEIVDNPGSWLIVNGQTWTAQYPMICFYDSNNNLLASYGNEPQDTAHNHNLVPIPFNTASAVVNGREPSARPIVRVISNYQLQLLLSNDVSAFGVAVTPEWLSTHASYSAIRNWPCNVVYNIDVDAPASITDLPDGFVTYGTLVKMNGQNSAYQNGYSTYLLVNKYGIWIGWDDNSSITWQRLGEKVPSTNVYDDFVTMSGTVTNGYAWNKNGSQSSPNENYLYTTYSVTPGDKLYISGYRYTTNICLFMVYDSSNNLLYYSGGSDTGGAESAVYSVPANAATVIVNGSKTNGYPIVQHFAFQTNLHEQLLAPKRRYLFIGDSYCEGYSHDGNNSGWATYCAGYLGLASDDYVRSYQGGSKFAPTSSLNFSDLIPNAYASDHFTDVVICGGYNDHSYTEANILSGISQTVTAVRSKYPKARIHIGFIAWNKAGNGSGAISTWQTIHTELIEKVLPAYQKCIMYGAEYLNNVEYWINDAGITNSDGYHPSAAGNQSLGRAIANALLTGSAPLPHNEALRL